MENQLSSFKFFWGDAWGSYGYGYRGSLNKTPEGNIISWSVDMEPFDMDLSGKEDEFISLLKECEIENWNGNLYTMLGVLDGNTWDLNVSYDGISSVSSGMNGYPITFQNLMNKLHEEWGLPYSELEETPFPFQEYAEDTEIRKLSSEGEAVDHKNIQIDEEAEARINLAYAMEAEKLNPELKKQRLELEQKLAKTDKDE